MRFGDLLVKLAMNTRLSQGELNALRNFGIETQRKNSLVSGYTYTQGGLKYDNSFALLFSEKFEVDKNTFSVEIPQEYNHIFMVTSGRSTDIPSRWLALRAAKQDSSAHTVQTLNAEDTSATGLAVSSPSPGGIVGTLTGAAQASDIASSSLCYFINIKSNFQKSALVFSAPASDLGIETWLVNTTWDGTTSVRTITFTLTATAAQKGSVISVYGIK